MKDIIKVFAVFQTYGDPDGNTAHDLLTIAATKQDAISSIATNELERKAMITQRYTERLEDALKAEQRQKEGKFVSRRDLFRPDFERMAEVNIAHDDMTKENNWTYIGMRDDCRPDTDGFGGYVVEEIEVFDAEAVSSKQ